MYYSLDSLLAGIAPANAHGEASFGKPVGKEALWWKHMAMCPMPVKSSG